MLQKTLLIILITIFFNSCDKQGNGTTNNHDITLNNLTHLTLINELQWQFSDLDLSSLDNQNFQSFAQLHNSLLRERKVDKVVYFTFEATDCNSCLEQQFQMLQSQSDYAEIVLLGIFERSRDSDIYLKQNDIESITLNNAHLPGHPISQLNDHQLSYYLEVDKSYKVLSVYFPMKEYPNITKAYLNSR